MSSVSKVNNNDQWNEGMKSLLDMTHQTAAQVFPNARIEWYGRGIQWDKVTQNWTGKERYIPSLSCSLYSIPKPTDMDRWFQKTCQLADKLDVEEITPWVSLGSGYQYSKGQKLWWDPDWQYDPKYAYQIGLKLNSLTDPNYSRVKVIVFYPEPFNAQAQYWWKHYIEYCRGAQAANVD